VSRDETTSGRAYSQEEMQKQQHDNGTKQCCFEVGDQAPIH